MANFNVKIIAEDYTVSPADDYIGVITELRPIAISIPHLTSLPNGKMFIIKDEGNNASLNNITVYTSDRSLIDEDRFQSITTDSGVLYIIKNGCGTGWSIINNSTATSSGGGITTDVTSITHGLAPVMNGVASQVLIDDGNTHPSWRQLTVDDLGAAFSANLSGGGTLEIGNSVVNPTFTASYTGGPATAATLTDTEGHAPVVLVSPFTTANTSHTFVKTANNASVVFTLNASKNSITSSPTASYAWRPFAYWGVSSNASGTTEAFIEALSNSTLASSLVRSISLSPGAGEYIYYSYPTSYGAATFTVGGFEGGFNLISSTIAVTNAYGVTQNYTLYRSTNANLGSTTVVVS